MPGRFLLQVSLGELRSRLDPERFRQVHRSHIVNLDHVQEMKPFDERRLVIALEGGRRDPGEPQGLGGAAPAGAVSGGGGGRGRGRRENGVGVPRHAVRLGS